MIDYLYYVKNMIKDANIERKEFLMSKIESHISQWLHYKNCKGRSPLHPEEFVSGNVHNFYFPTNESIQLVWDIDKIYRKSIAIQPKEFELPELQEIIKKDIISSLDEFTKIENEVHNIQRHHYAAVIIFYFSPLRIHLMIDGRHRFIEHRKFKQQEKILAFVLDSDKYLDCIVYKRDYAAYIILHNIEVMSRYLEGMNCLKELW